MHPGAGASQVRQTRPAQRYTVRPGDTYWALAQRYYGNPLDWPKIAAANGYAPTRIPVGAVLTIPA
jgi:5'-nucleotidase